MFPQAVTVVAFNDFLCPLRRGCAELACERAGAIQSGERNREKDNLANVLKREEDWF